ncbi:AMP-binding protein [Sediminivirga luteola]|uniref:acetate--CoA ligase n=1 Tax=Sediminivirga luteola TaxID=1774748 RepID=A0A8J2TVL9_9MICO|nr:AMP-binding protein [Sediminivirga luteola]GGA04547.1 acetyl-coenzyme A synthetase [Sediminivirga luteola]
MTGAAGRDPEFSRAARERGVDTAAWERVMERLDWDVAPQELWREGEYGGEWFAGGRLNLSVNALDRHVDAGHGDRVAMHWEGEPGDRRSLSYRELLDDVKALAAALRGLGIGTGDRVGIHLGWLPETVTAMLASMRIGAVYSVLPAPLPAEALADRLAAQQPRILLTQDGAWRHGTVMPLKARADEALTAIDSVEQTIVVRRTGMDVAWYEGDLWYHELAASGAARVRREEEAGRAASLPSGAPVCTVSLANRGGRPASTVHGNAHLAVSLLAVHGALRPQDGRVFWCAGDIAWAVSQFSGVIGPLLRGDTPVMYEGTLDVPTQRRAWEILARYRVGTMVTPPSVLRAMRAWHGEPPDVAQHSALQKVVTAGEAVEPELQQWIRDALGGAGGDALQLGDAWGQLQLGGIVVQNGLSPAEPIPGCGLDVIEDPGSADGRGEAVLRLPWPGSIRGVEGEPAEEIARQWTRLGEGLYATGDLARRVPGGQAGTGTGPDEAAQTAQAAVSLEFLGRKDDVVSISGQLVSFTEVREVLLDHPFVREALVTVRPDARLGRSLVAAVVVAQEAAARAATPEGAENLAIDLMNAVRELLGGLARPRSVVLLDRIGDDLDPDRRDQAIAALAAPPPGVVRRLSWEQVRAAGQDAQG